MNEEAQAVFVKGIEVLLSVVRKMEYDSKNRFGTIIKLLLPSFSFIGMSAFGQ